MPLVKQSGIIPYTCKDDELMIMLVTSRNDGLWIFPKGHLEPDMTPAESAEKEAFEEAGVTGVLYHEMIFSYRFERFGNPYEVEVYLLEMDTVLDESEWEEAAFRKRKLVPYKKAVKMVEYDHLKNALKKVPDAITGLRSV